MKERTLASVAGIVFAMPEYMDYSADVDKTIDKAMNESNPL